MKKVLITGAGTGFGHEVAMRLAEKGFDVDRCRRDICSSPNPEMASCRTRGQLESRET